MDYGSLALLTDLYQLTMAYGYWKTGLGDDEAVFHAGFRKEPFNGGYAVSCGLGPLLDLLRDYRFVQSDLDYLAGLRGGDDEPLFEDAFLRYLQELRLTLDVDAIPEGTTVFANQPLVRVSASWMELFTLYADGEGLRARFIVHL